MTDTFAAMQGHGDTTLTIGELTAIIGDNSANGQHGSGYNGVWRLRHSAGNRSLFVPDYAVWTARGHTIIRTDRSEGRTVRGHAIIQGRSLDRTVGRSAFGDTHSFGGTAWGQAPFGAPLGDTHLISPAVRVIQAFPDIRRRRSTLPVQ